MSVPDSARQLDAPPVDAPAPALERVRRLVIEQPLIMLGVILVLLVIACVIAESSYLSTGQLGAILRYAAPLAIMAGGQTLAMLTPSPRPNGSQGRGTARPAWPSRTATMIASPIAAEV